jgi:Na+/H+ antiporter NhaC
MDVGEVVVTKGGRHEISVNVAVVDSREEGSTVTTAAEYEAYGKGVALIPLIMILILAVTTNMVEFSLFVGVFVGACMVQGTIIDGFLRTLDFYILEALADIGHGYVYLFTLFLAGLVGMMERSGGMFGFTRDIGIWATTARTGQLACFSVGIFVFFDDYANVLLAGKTLRPLLDLLFVSREKLAFVVDATAAPIASISPVSSWVGYEVGLIQEQLDRIIEMNGGNEAILGDIKSSGFGVFLQSIKYRYYPIFMIVLMVGLIYSQRDMGTMLIAERNTRVYQRRDGGPGRIDGPAGEDEFAGNAPRKGTPELSFNMIVPVLVLVFFIFYLLVKTGDSGEGDQSFMDKIEASDSYSALLWGTMAATIITLLFYLLQPVRDGSLIAPDGDFFMQIFQCGGKPSGEEQEALDQSSESEKTHPLMNVRDSMDGFLYGMGRIFPALIVLTLAWASGTIMVAVGCDRLFSGWIVGGGIPVEILPTLSFVISLFMALATGTSWGTMSILFPLILVPTFQASNGDAEIFYAVVAGVLSGSVAGDHMSPISDTTVLTALACDCQLLPHVYTQAPYVIICCLISILLGTIPIGYDAWPNIIGVLLGAGLTLGFVYGYCQPVISPTGKFDILTELWLATKKESPLHKLKEDTIKAHSGELAVASPSSDGGENEKMVEPEKAVDDVMKNEGSEELLEEA